MLLDTHIFLWLAIDISRIPTHLLEQISLAKTLWVSPISFQEISIKNRKHPASFPVTVQQALKIYLDLRCQSLAYKLGHVIQYDRLPQHHFDPYDRMLVAQSISEQIPLISIDPIIKKYEGTYQNPEGITVDFRVLS